MDDDDLTDLLAEKEISEEENKRREREQRTRRMTVSEVSFFIQLIFVKFNLILYFFTFWVYFYSIYDYYFILPYVLRLHNFKSLFIIII